MRNHLKNLQHLFRRSGQLLLMHTCTHADTRAQLDAKRKLHLHIKALLEVAIVC